MQNAKCNVIRNDKKLHNWLFYNYQNKTKIHCMEFTAIYLSCKELVLHLRCKEVELPE